MDISQNLLRPEQFFFLTKIYFKRTSNTWKRHIVLQVSFFSSSFLESLCLKLSSSEDVLVCRQHWQLMPLTWCSLHSCPSSCQRRWGCRPWSIGRRKRWLTATSSCPRSGSSLHPAATLQTPVTTPKTPEELPLISDSNTCQNNCRINLHIFSNSKHLNNEHNFVMQKLSCYSKNEPDFLSLPPVIIAKELTWFCDVNTCHSIWRTDILT